MSVNLLRVFSLITITRETIHSLFPCSTLFINQELFTLSKVLQLDHLPFSDLSLGPFLERRSELCDECDGRSLTFIDLYFFFLMLNVNTLKVVNTCDLSS